MSRLRPGSTVFLLCDVQERFRSVIHKFPAVVRGAHRMIGAAKELGIPVIVTEQYPRGLGHTVEELDLSNATGVYEKVLFSMITPEVTEKLASLEHTDAVIFGMEAHVCVLQTSLDLLELGKNVHICVDATSSQQTVDRTCGLRRAERAGAQLTTTESVLMELIRSKEHPSFKAISSLLKETKVEDPLDAV